jgi:NPCBM-associated, NEW3 domain of alpha-galactosidase
MGVRLLVALPLILLLSGCGGQKPAAGAPLVPWIDTKPSGLHQGLATPVGSVRLCHREDLQAIYGGSTVPVGGKVTGTIDLFNISQNHSDCLIQGIPTVQVFARQGQIELTQTPIETAPFVPVLLNPAVGTPTPLNEKAGARLGLEWRVDDSGTGKCSPGLEYATTAQLLLAGPEDAVLVDSFVEKSGLAVSFCPRYLGVGAFQPVTGNAESLSPRYWKATLDVPPTAAVGKALMFKVTLQNVYYRALEFRNGCPGYIETLAGPDGWTMGKEFFLLNCEGIGAIAPGASVTFAMVIQIPPSAPAGDYYVIWELDTGLTSYGSTAATFIVTAH